MLWGMTFADDVDDAPARYHALLAMREQVHRARRTPLNVH